MGPEFLRTLNRLAHEGDYDFGLVESLRDQFRQFDLGIQKTLKKDPAKAYDILVNAAKILAAETKHIQKEFVRSERKFDRINSQLKAMGLARDGEVARNSWLIEKGVRNLTGSGHPPISEREVRIHEDKLEFYRSLVIFTDGAIRQILLAHLVEKFPSRVWEQDVSPLLRKYLPEWSIDRKLLIQVKKDATRKVKDTIVVKFETFLTAEGQRLLPFLVKEYHDSGPIDMAALLFCLRRGALLSKRLDKGQEVWMDSITAAFELKKPLQRGSFYVHILEWKAPSEKQREFLKEHQERLTNLRNNLGRDLSRFIIES